ncbi:uncharacterized protein LOC117552546 [Gymnodraco acuticeps]|uniref:Uncharacterized protein LOC117552546 n=1 Tax=Gymnodraco acuticeps TaxID=8218 RepID=A0A6P8UYE0_GYMAC|nr:uncharacterized protein LOC117552546 [Gymnodraco acuticeps]
MATSKKSTPWSTEEVMTFLHLIGDDKIQRELDGTTRNVKVFQDVSAQMSERGREGGLDSATALLESLQDDYIGTREEEHSRTTGDGSVPSTSSLHPEQTPAEDPNPTQPPTPSAITTPQRVVLGKRKRGGEYQAQQQRHHEQHMAQQERHLDWAKASAERRWELDAALRREEAALAREEAALRREEAGQTETFNLAFLRTLGEVLGGLGSRRGPSPPRPT